MKVEPDPSIRMMVREGRIIRTVSIDKGKPIAYRYDNGKISFGKEKSMPSDKPWSCPLCGEESNKWPVRHPLQSHIVKAACPNCWRKATNPPPKRPMCRFTYESEKLLRAESKLWKRKFIDIGLARKPGQSLPHHPPK
jgi:hypothetical protein